MPERRKKNMVRLVGFSRFFPSHSVCECFSNVNKKKVSILNIFVSVKAANIGSKKETASDLHHFSFRPEMTNEGIFRKNKKGFFFSRTTRLRQRSGRLRSSTKLKYLNRSSLFELPSAVKP